MLFVADERLKLYVEELKKRGFGNTQIRQQLLDSGYPQSTVDELIKKNYVFHYILVLLILFGIIAVVAYTFQFFFQETILTVQSIIPSKTIKNMQALQYTTKLKSNAKTSAVIKTEVLDFETSKIVFSSQEKVDLKDEKFLAKVLQINDSFTPGKYLLRTKVNYDDKTTGTSAEFYVEAGEKPKTAPIPAIILPASTETPIPSPALLPTAAPAKKILLAEECPVECDDYNACTKDSCVNGRCEFRPISPCCGNLVCEQGETVLNCIGDCAKREKSDEQKIAEAKEIVKSDKEKAASVCSAVANAGKLDSCFSELAEITFATQFCSSVQKRKTKDACYSFLAVKGAFSCSNIEDRLLRNSCNSLERSRDLMAQANAV